MLDPIDNISKNGSVASKRILVVDDEPLVCDALKMMLSFEGHVVTVKNSAEAALSVLETDAFDMVITDFAMPGMRGNEMASRIKSQRPQMPIVMITAYAEMLDSKKDSLGGVDCLVSKPFMMEDLRRAILSASSKY